MSQINPKPILRSILGQLIEERNVLCPNYDFCLDMAVRGRWENFSCSSCSSKSLISSRIVHDCQIREQENRYPIRLTQRKKIKAGFREDLFLRTLSSLETYLLKQAK